MSPHTLFYVAMASLLPAALVLADSCPATQPEHFCCESFGHFSDNFAVWHGICGLDFPNSTTVGSFCSELTPWYGLLDNAFGDELMRSFDNHSPTGLIALCCETQAGKSLV